MSFKSHYTSGTQSRPSNLYCQDKWLYILFNLTQGELCCNVHLRTAFLSVEVSFSVPFATLRKRNHKRKFLDNVLKAGTALTDIHIAGLFIASCCAD